MFTKGQGIRRAKASSLAKSSSLATGSDTDSLTSPRPRGNGCSVPLQGTMIDWSHHPSDFLWPPPPLHHSQAPNPLLLALHIQLLFLSKASQSLFPISSADVFHKNFAVQNHPCTLAYKTILTKPLQKISENPFKFSGIQNFTETNQKYLNEPRLSSIYIGIVSG